MKTRAPLLPKRIRRVLLQWPGSKRLSLGTWLLSAFAGLSTVLLLAALVFAGLSWWRGGERGWFGLDQECNDNTFSCGALVEIVPTGLAVGVTVALFVYWRVRRVSRKHLEGALTEPWRLVPTATEMPEVVGRDGICAIIERDLHYPAGRRPQIIVGGIGEGKTAVLVRLTQQLARHGAVPVPIQLSEAEEPLDFAELAKKRFLSRVDQNLITDDEGDKVWRRLCRDDRVVILADGLEEALPDSSGRDAAIRKAVGEAGAKKMPLVIASRPDEALRGLSAALIRLEPLSQRATVEYLCQSGKREPDEVRELAEVAQLAESPLYMELARDLYNSDGVADVCVDEGRVNARVEVLERWRGSILNGSVHGQMHLPEDRTDALEGLESMACMALRDGSMDIDLDAVPDWPYAARESVARARPKLAANVGQDMGVVVRRGSKVRFRHGVIEAYLGARGLSSVVQAPARVTREKGSDGLYLCLDVLRQPSRELLVALVVACCLPEPTAQARQLCDILMETAISSKAADPFGLLGAAWEIAAATGHDDRPALATATELAWTAPRPRAIADELRLSETKRLAIARMEEAPAVETYRALWTICTSEDDYRVRLRAAQALGSGGSQAHQAIRAEIDGILDDACKPSVQGRWTTAEAADVRRWSLVGWILPSLLASCRDAGTDQVGHIRESLETWVRLACEGLHLGAEACLAQGFKYEANLLPPRSTPETRATLIGHATALLGATKWWYSQISLLQALALWSLDGGSARKANLDAPFEGWRGKQHHPYVRLTARLCDEARRDGQQARGNVGAPRPGRFIWIDETGIAAKVGSRSALPDLGATAGLWISPAAGWHTLRQDARQLVADILIYSNLIEVGDPRPGGHRGSTRSDQVQERESRRRKVCKRKAWLPPCMVKSGHGGLLAGVPQGDADGPCNCEAELCPYPARGEPLFRGELGETFCREQHRLLRRFRPFATGVPSWHERSLNPKHMRRSTVRQFWSDMEKRARELNAKSLSAGS